VITDVLVSGALATAPAFIAYYLTALGHGFFEKSGVLNLAIDGVFYLSVAVAYATAVYTHGPWGALAITMAVASVFGMLIAYLTTKFPVSHGAVGLSVMFLGYGIGALIGNPAVFAYRDLRSRGVMFDIRLPTEPAARALMYVTAVLAGLAILYLAGRTKLGAAVRAAGENPHAASALGVDVLRVRLIAGAIGYALIGAGATFFELAWLPTWQQLQGMGHGWLAFAISLSAGRHPLLTMVTSAAFAGLLTYQYALQAAYNLSPEVAKMIPFIAAIVAMVLFMVTPLRRRLAPPLSLGKVYFKEERTV